MGFRFRRSVRVFPGIRINLSKSGASLSAGARGAHINIGTNGVHETISVPGTGLSYRTGNLARSAPAPRPSIAPKYSPGLVRLVLGVALVVLVSVVGTLTH